MRIVALLPGGIDHQVLSFPTLDTLKQAYPNAQIDVIVEPTSKEAYRVSKSVHEAIAFDFLGRNSLADWGNLLGILRDREYSVALFSGQSWTVSFILWLAGIPTRIGFAQTPGANFLTHLVSRDRSQYSATTQHSLLKGLGIHTPSPEISVNVPVKDLDWADAERKRLSVGATGYVLIAASADASTVNGKTYPLESWQSIIQDFQQKQPDMPLVIVKDSENAAFVDTLVKAKPGLKVTTPPDIGKLTAIIAGANLMLCTEGAPMHLAVAVKTYTLALFGASEPKQLLPDNKRFIGIKSLTGQMADISPQTVLEKVWGG
jgi:ADP-heptose:LPS heptosyltransferase